MGAGMKLVALTAAFVGAALAGASNLPASINAFNTAAYKQVAGHEGNLILSPFNIASALSMLLAGARGQTAKEIESVLHIAYGPSYDSSLSDLIAGLQSAGNTGANELHTANGVWVQRGLPLQPEFERTLTTDYKALLTPLDFRTNPEGARSTINQWTEEQTKEKIKDLLPAGSLDSATRLVLTSAIYFYGKWQAPFAAMRTRPAGFASATGQMQTNFMNQTAHFDYGETPEAQILEMPYAGTGIAFDVLLPKGASGLSDLETSLTLPNLTDWLSKLSRRNVEVMLPKFRAESEFSLRNELSSMGMPTCFTNSADLSGIDPKGGLKVSEVFHKAFVDVSEEGTEAAAATGVGIRAAAIRVDERPIVFRADHPFVFLIRDTRSGVVLFIGRLARPA